MLILSDGSGSGYNVNGDSSLSRTVQQIATRAHVNADQALVSLRNFLDGGAPAANISTAVLKAAITAAESSNTELKALLDGPLGQFFLDLHAGNQLPTPRTLQNVTAPLSYALEKSATATPISPGDVHWTFGAQAKAEATISVFTASNGSDPALPAIPNGDALLRFEVSGNVDIDGSFKVPFNGGSASGLAAVGAGVALNALFEWPATNSVVGAVVESASNLCSPWSLDDVDQSLVTKNALGEYRGLRQIGMTTNGSMQITGSIGVGSVWAYVAKDFASAVNLNGSFNLSLNVGWSRSGTFNLCVQRAENGAGIEVDVRRGDATSREFGVDFTAGLNITGLGQLVQPIVDRAFPDPKGLLADLRKWTAPGSLLVEALQQKIPANDDLLSALAGLLLGTTTQQDAADQVRTLIANEIKEQVDAVIPFWGQIEQPQQLAQQLTARVVSRFGIEGAVADKLASALRDRLESVIEDLFEAFQKEVTKLAKTAGDLLAAKLEPLAAVGEDVQKLKDAIDQKADAIIEPAIKLLTKYEQLRDKVVAAVSVANKLKMGLELKAAYQKQTADQSELRLCILKITDRTRLVYRSLLLGRLDSVWGLLQSAIDNNEIDLLEGAFTSAIMRKKQVDLSIYFGDWAIAWQNASAASTQVTVDANGMISLDSQARFSSTAVVKAFGGSNGASFGGTIDIASVARNSKLLPVTLGFSLNYTDQRMTRKELAAYIDSLVEESAPIHLLDDGAVDKSLASYEAAGTDARLDTVVNLDTNALSRILLLTGTSDGQQRILMTARAALFCAKATMPENRRTFLSMAAMPDASSVARLFGEIEPVQTDVERFSKRYTDKTGQPLPTSGGITSPASRALSDVAKINRLARGLLDGLTALQQCQSVLTTTIQSAEGLTPAQKARLYVTTLDGINGRVVDGIGGWFRQPPWIHNAPSWAVALLSTFAQLGDVPAPLLVPVLQFRSQGQMRVLAF